MALVSGTRATAGASLATVPRGSAACKFPGCGGSPSTRREAATPMARPVLSGASRPSRGGRSAAVNQHPSWCIHGSLGQASITPSVGRVTPGTLRGSLCTVPRLGRDDPASTLHKGTGAFARRDLHRVGPAGAAARYAGHRSATALLGPPGRGRGRRRQAGAVHAVGSGGGKDGGGGGGAGGGDGGGGGNPAVPLGLGILAYFALLRLSGGREAPWDGAPQLLVAAALLGLVFEAAFQAYKAVRLAPSIVEACPGCGAVIQAPSLMEGTQVRFICPACQLPLQVSNKRFLQAAPAPTIGRGGGGSGGRGFAAAPREGGPPGPAARPPGREGAAGRQGDMIDVEGRVVEDGDRRS